MPRVPKAWPRPSARSTIRHFSSMFRPSESAWRSTRSGQICRGPSACSMTPTPNAFAFPGGYIFITRGLMGLMGNEAELVSVLGP